MTHFKFADIAGWIPEPVDPVALENWVGNLLLGLKVSPNHLWEKAFTKWELREGKILDEAVIRARGFNDKEIFEIIIDGACPTGVVKISDLGTIVAPPGANLKFGKMGAQVIVGDQRLTIPLGEIVLLPTKQPAKVLLFGGLKIDKKSEVVINDVGKVGLVVDLRGRPLPVPSADREGRERLMRFVKIWS